MALTPAQKRYRTSEKGKNTQRRYYSTSKVKKLRAGYARRHCSLKRWILRSYKIEKGCQVCGTKDWVVLQFHHLDPSTKSVRLGQKLQNLGWDQMFEEIDKCAVLCANCHIREEHKKRVAFRE